MKKNTLIFIVLMSIMLLGFLYYITFREDPIKKQIENVKKNPPKIPEIKEDVLKNLMIETNAEGSERIHAEYLSLEQIIALYRKVYGKKIYNKWAQIKFIEDLIRMLKERYPDSWVTELYVIIHSTFPDLAGEIFQRFEKLQEYNQWLEKNRDDLMKLQPEERVEALWNKRYEMFGEEVAKEIWAAELRAQQFKESLKQIDQSSGDINQKVQEFRSSLQKIYGEEFQDFLSKKSSDITDNFLQLSSIQKELKNMDTDTRYKTLKQIRLSLGMDPNAVQRLETLDKERDIRWEIGTQYTIEREELLKSGASEEEMHKLRLKFFNPEMAEILKQEEESGFFRFKEERNYGLD
ncbi:MAG: hypothetical protein ACK4UJ_10235 [Leptonema sp. (in: bacteria)]